MCRIMEELGRDYAREMAISIAMKMISDNLLPYEKIAQYSGLTIEEVKELAKEMESVNA